MELLISRLHPQTSCNEVKECADSIVQAGNIVPLEIQCQSLKPNVESSSSSYFRLFCSCHTQLITKDKILYASFHVSLRVDSADLSHAITLLMNADLWPAGVFVKRYYTVSQKNDHIFIFQITLSTINRF